MGGIYLLGLLFVNLFVPSKPSIPIVQTMPDTPPYTVVWELGLYDAAKHRTTRGTGWFVGYPPTREAKGYLMPSNVTCMFWITNNRDTTTLIQSYSVDMATQSGSFKRLNRLSITGMSVWSGMELTSLAQVSDDSIMLDKVAHSPIQGHSTIKGWALFQYPTDDGTSFDPKTIKVIIRDNSGKPYTSPPLTAPTSKPVQDIVVPITGSTNFDGATIDFTPDERD